jgi:hypothetical protein
MVSDAPPGRCFADFDCAEIRSNHRVTRSRGFLIAGWWAPDTRSGPVETKSFHNLRTRISIVDPEVASEFSLVADLIAQPVESLRQKPGHMHL